MRENCIPDDIFAFDVKDYDTLMLERRGLMVKDQRGMRGCEGYLTSLPTAALAQRPSRPLAAVMRHAAVCP